MSFGFLGIQFGWGLQMSNMSPIYKYLGASDEQIPLLWLAALAGCSAATAAPITGGKTDTLVLNPLGSAPTCPAGLACMYARSSDSQVYDVDAAGVVLKTHAAKSYRTSSNCAGLASPANGDVCYANSECCGGVCSGSGSWTPACSSMSVRRRASSMS